MAGKIPPELRKIAGDAARAELAYSDCDCGCRQMGSQIGNIVLQAVWPHITGTQSEAQPAYLSALRDATDEQLSEALIHLGPVKCGRLRMLLAGES